MGDELLLEARSPQRGADHLEDLAPARAARTTLPRGFTASLLKEDLDLRIGSKPTRGPGEDFGVASLGAAVWRWKTLEESLRSD